MTIIPAPLRLEIIPESRGRFYRLLMDWYFYSEILRQWVKVPAGFVWDLESIPLYKGSNPAAGTAHDYMCRIDSVPVVDKLTAARIYCEVAACEDREVEKAGVGKTTMGRFKADLAELWDWLTRGIKRDVVTVAPGYFHKHKVAASYEEMSGEI